MARAIVGSSRYFSYDDGYDMASSSLLDVAIATIGSGGCFLCKVSCDVASFYMSDLTATTSLL